MRTRDGKSRGFAMLMAVAMLALAAGTLLLLARHFSYQTMRTRLTIRDAQLSQLLLAGAQDVNQKSRDWPETIQAASWRIQLPRPLSDAGAKLSVNLRSTTDAADATIEARFDSGIAVQTLHYRRDQRGWSAASVDLLGAK